MDYFAVKTKSKSKKSPSKTKSKSASKSKSGSKSKSMTKSKSASKMSMVKKHKNKLAAGAGLAATLAGLGLLYKNREAVKSKMDSGRDSLSLKSRLFKRMFGRPEKRSIEQIIMDRMTPDQKKQMEEELKK